MADDIKQKYKQAINIVSKEAENIYSDLQKKNYLRIDMPTKQYFLHVTEVTPIQSENKVIYDINVTGSGIMFNLDDRGEIIAATVSGSISPDGILTGATVSPDDDPVVLAIDSTTYADAVSQLTSFANEL